MARAAVEYAQKPANNQWLPPIVCEMVAGPGLFEPVLVVPLPNPLTPEYSSTAIVES